MLGVFIGPCALLTAFEPCDHIISHLVRMSFLPHSGQLSRPAQHARWPWYLQVGGTSSPNDAFFHEGFSTTTSDLFSLSWLSVIILCTSYSAFPFALSVNYPFI